MKRIIALLVAFAFVLSLAACGNTERIQEERVQVNDSLEGTWFLYEDSSLGKLNYIASFGYGVYSFDTYPDDSLTPIYEEVGVYSIDVSNHEILCTSEDGRSRYFSYQFDSGNLLISSGIGQYTKTIDGIG